MTTLVAPRHSGLTRRDATIVVAVFALAVGLWALRWRGAPVSAR